MVTTLTDRAGIGIITILDLTDIFISSTHLQGGEGGGGESKG